MRYSQWTTARARASAFARPKSVIPDVAFLSVPQIITTESLFSPALGSLPMKPVVLIIGTSLAANAALLGLFAARPNLAPPSVRSFFTASDTTPAQSAASLSAAQPGKRSSVAAPWWHSLETPDLTTLVARLRAAGFPPAILRSIIDAEIEARFAPRIQALTRELNETPYWKPDPSLYAGNTRLFESISQIYRERSQLLRGLLGQDAFAYSGVDPSAAQQRQYGNLSEAKISLVQRIVDDYAEMIGQVRTAMQGVTLPEDREKLALLEREKRADLAAMLTPAELADYEMRSSPITGRLRTPLSIMNASEAEFRKIFEIQQPYANVISPGVGLITMEMSQQRRDATAKINEQIKAALGDERFAQYERASQSEFQQLHRLGTAEGVSYDAMAKAFSVRGPTATASAAIMNDRNLSADDKRNALKNLAQTARTEILSTLGPTVGPAYAEGARWLTHIAQGGSVSIMPDGNMSYRMSPPMNPPGTTPAR